MAKAPAKKAAAKGAPEAEAPAAKPKKKGGGAVMTLIAAVAGLALGGGAVAGYFTQIAPEARAEKKKEEEEAKRREAPETVKIDRMVVPLVGQDGSLAGYLTLDLMLYLEPEQGEFVKPRLPYVRHAINEVMATQPMTLLPDNKRLDFDKAGTTLTAAANKALEEDVVRAIKISSAVPL